MTDYIINNLMELGLISFQHTFYKMVCHLLLVNLITQQSADIHEYLWVWLNYMLHFCAEMFLVTAVLLSPFLLVAQSADEVNATVYYDG